MRRLAVLLIGLLALWAAPFASRALDVSGGGGCVADCTFTEIQSPSGSTLTLGTVGPQSLIFKTQGIVRWTMSPTNGIFYPEGGFTDIGVDTSNPVNELFVMHVGFQPTTFASLGLKANGHVQYCSDCTIANPCASGGTGAMAKRLNTVWVCN
jgi:hypothetical protein